jgi:hypothetical protein
MRALADHHRQRRGAEQPVGLRIPAHPGEQRVAGGGQAGGVGHGGAGDERQPGVGGQP